MEEGQRLPPGTRIANEKPVLILVVMEEGQRPSPAGVTGLPICCLNPCCNGRGSKTPNDATVRLRNPCLNPCCNGRGSKTFR